MCCSLFVSDCHVKRKILQFIYLKPYVIEVFVRLWSVNITQQGVILNVVILNSVIFFISTQLPNLIHQITSGGKENSFHKMKYRITLEPIFKLVFIDGDYGQI